MIRSLQYRFNNSKMFKTASASFSMRFTAAGVGFVCSILLARLLGPNELGVYAIAMAAVNFAATVASLGFPSLVTRNVAKYTASEQWGLLKGLIKTSHRWVAVAIIVVMMVSFGVLQVGIGPSNMSVLTLTFGMLLIPLSTFSQLRASILRGLHHVLLADIPELLLRPVLMLSLVAGAYFLLGNVSSEQAIMFQLIAAIPAFILGAWFLRERTHGAIKCAVSQFQVRTWGKEVPHFFWISMVVLLEGQIGLYMLGYLANLEQVALFQVASQLVSLVIMGLVAVNQPLYPRLAAAWAREDSAELQRLVMGAAKLGCVVAFVSAVIFLPFSELVIHIYGDQYLASSNVLRILVIGQIINAISGPCGLLLASTGQQKLVLTGVVVALVVNIIVGVMWIPSYGAIGAALATTMGLLVWNGALVYWAAKKVKINTSIFCILKKRNQV